MKELMQPIDRLSGKYRHKSKTANINLLPLPNTIIFFAITLLTYDSRQ